VLEVTRGAAAAWAILVLFVRPARGDETHGCIAAYESGQRLRIAGKLREARDELARCAALECPTLAREDCVRWLREVDDAVPTVIVRARDPSGSDLVDVRVTVDGAPLVTHLEGRPIAFDPGEHDVRFEAPGFVPSTEHLVVVQAEKNRVFEVVLRPEPPKRVPTAEQPEPRPRTSMYVLAGIGVGAAVGAAIFGVAGWSHVSALHNSPCAANKTCDPSDVDRARRELVAADILTVVAIASIGAATWLWLAPRSR
jgi:hypothetical protein